MNVFSIVVGGQWSVVGGLWSVVSGRWSVVSGQWSVVGGRWSVVSGRWPVSRSHAVHGVEEDRQILEPVSTGLVRALKRPERNRVDRPEARGYAKTRTKLKTENPQLETLNSKPETQSSKLKTPNSKPQTQNPKLTYRLRAL